MNSLAALLDWYATLTPASLDRIAQFYAADAHFRDPFNDVHGVPAIATVFRHMFAHTEAPRFEIAERIEQGEQAFVTWTFHFGLRGRAYAVAGGSHLRFGADGRVIMHRDYWDAAEELWQQLPVLGPPVRWLRKRFRAA
ncbi:nuclear transport factor 2 family protein [Massilia arenosa]|uniref:Nuclear transport factor 2 family protein n=1 Tax=Zemynaea arenosa TaxID=2561931 RepID=A0A4Y9SA96_9BURK|nr:nuclear transport factor 2 family protein [Massilia arenosa]TFW16650.1 nuclear transport factor 2 family protein [Massilia arenosa]